MGWKSFFKRRSYGWRVEHYIDQLEDHHDTLPSGYEEEKEVFQSAFKRYLRDRSIYILTSLLFYASIVTSVTASIGFKFNIFEKIYGVLGFSTVILLFFLAKYNLRLSKADFENARSRIVAFLTTHET